MGTVSRMIGITLGDVVWSSALGIIGGMQVMDSVAIWVGICAADNVVTIEAHIGHFTNRDAIICAVRNICSFIFCNSADSRINIQSEIRFAPWI